MGVSPSGAGRRSRALAPVLGLALIVPPYLGLVRAPSTIGPGSVAIVAPNVATTESLSVQAIRISEASCSVVTFDQRLKKVDDCSFTGAGGPSLSRHGLRATFGGTIDRLDQERPPGPVPPPKLRAGSSTRLPGAPTQLFRSPALDGAWVVRPDPNVLAHPVSVGTGCRAVPGAADPSKPMDPPLCEVAAISDPPALSGDGAWMAFATVTPLRAEDADGAGVDVYVARLPSGAPIEPAPVLASRQAPRFAREPALDGTGRRLAYVSEETVDDAARIVIVVARLADDGTAFEPLKVSAPADVGRPSRPFLSEAGRWMAFTAIGVGYTPYVVDLESVPPAAVPVPMPPGLVAPSGARVTGFSGDGRFVALAVPSSTTNTNRGFVVDWRTGRAAEVAPAGAELSDGPVLAPDGTAAAFAAWKPIVPIDVNETQDVYIQNIDITGPDAPKLIGPVALVSPGDVAVDAGGGPSAEPAISGGGGRIVFASEAAGLPTIVGDKPVVGTIGPYQVFSVDRLATPTLTVIPPSGPVPVEGEATFTVALESTSNSRSAPVLTVKEVTATAGEGGRIVENSRTCDGQPIYVEKGCTLTIRARFDRAGTGSIDVKATVIDHLKSSVAPDADRDIEATHPLTRQSTVRVARGNLRIEPDPVSFRTQRTGVPSAPALVTVTNDGPVPVRVSGATVRPAEGLPGGDSFDVVADACSGTAIAVGASCQVQVVFTPRGDGQATALLEVASDAVNGTARVALQGPGARAMLTIEPTPQDLGVVKVGGRAVATFTVTNAGSTGSGVETVTAGIRQVELRDGSVDREDSTPAGSGPAYEVAEDHCRGEDLAPRETCTVTVAFAPTTIGRFRSNLRVVSDAANAPVAEIDGRGDVGELVVQPAAIDLGTHRADALPAPVPVTVVNAGPAPVVVGTAMVTGGDFDHVAIEADGCSGTTLAPGASCTLSVRFVPRFAGPRATTLAIPNDGRVGTVAVALTGAVVPVLRAVPASGRPRDVATLIGRGFPPGAEVRIAWDGHPGAAVRVADDGGVVRAGLLVLGRMAVGERQASAADPSAAPRWAPVPLDRPYLVVGLTYEPPDLVARG